MEKEIRSPLHFSTGEAGFPQHGAPNNFREALHSKAKERLTKSFLQEGGLYVRPDVIFRFFTMMLRFFFLSASENAPRTRQLAWLACLERPEDLS